MGQCNSTGYSRKFTLDELKDMKVGETKELAKGCGPAVSGVQGGSCYDWLKKRGFGWPENGEFAWGGMGSNCSMCSDVANGYGCDNCTGGKAIGGKRGTVKRVAYLGDKVKCCTQQVPLVDGKTCDPKYRTQFSTSDCDEAMASYCQGNTLKTPICVQWTNVSLDKKRSAPNAALKKWCAEGNNFKDPTCQTWCDKTKNIVGMQGECDQAALSYCSRNKTDPLCACLQPPENVSKVENLMASAKVCWYKPCQTLVNDNYITSTMRDQKRNCVSTACLIEAGDISISGSENKVEFKNECVTNIVKPSAKPVPPTPTPTPIPTPPVPSPKPEPKPQPEPKPITGSAPAPIEQDPKKTTEAKPTTGTPMSNSDKLALVMAENSTYIYGGVALSSLASICLLILCVIILFLMMNSKKK